MSRNQRRQEREARSAALRRRRLLVGVVLGLVVGVGLMSTVDTTLGIAVGMLIALAGVWLAQRV